MKGKGKGKRWRERRKERKRKGGRSIKRYYSSENWRLLKQSTKKPFTQKQVKLLVTEIWRLLVFVSRQRGFHFLKCSNNYTITIEQYSLFVVRILHQGRDKEEGKKLINRSVKTEGTSTLKALCLLSVFPPNYSNCNVSLFSCFSLISQVCKDKTK